MIDIVFPKNNEDEFIRMAELIGLEGLCFVYETPRDTSLFQNNTRIKISSAILCTPDNIRKYKGKYITIIKSPDDQTRLRTIIEQAKPDIIYGLETANRADFIHHRASGLNHVLARIANVNDLVVGFSFSDVISAPPRKRAAYLGRMRQNIIFSRKFKFKTRIATFTDNPWMMRPENDLESLFRTIGKSRGD